MCGVRFDFFFYHTKTLKTAAIAPLHTGHWDTALEQFSQRQRWPHGTTAYSASSSKQMAHSLVTRLVDAGLGGLGSGDSGSSPVAVMEAAGFATAPSSSQVRTEC